MEHVDESPILRQWRNRVNTICDSLERKDLGYVSKYRSWEDARQQLFIAQGTSDDAASQAFGSLFSASKHLKSFADHFSGQLNPKLDISIIWSLLGLIAKIASDEEQAAFRIPQMLRTICLKLEVLNKYCVDPLDSSFDIREESSVVAQAILSFLFNTIAFMRCEQWYEASRKASSDEWKPLKEQFSTVIQEIGDSVSRIEKTTKLATRPKKPEPDEVQSTFSTLSNSGPARPTSPLPHLAEEEARLPCFIPPPFRTSRFFNRDEIISEIEDFFNSPLADHSLTSLALFGLGGVGKSSVALKYAEKKLQASELDAMFWVPSEKLVTIQQTFTNIALRLKLPDARTADHSENHALVINWLQHTQSRWLIIYDNVESMDVLLPYWPAAGHGQAILTTRDHRFAFEIAQKGLEIESWDAKTGSQFLVHLLATNIGDQLSADDIQSANQLSDRLSGHALAISHMAGLIHGRGWSIAEFIEEYDQQPQMIHGISDNKSINALWNISFKTLDPQSRAILGVLSFVSPDSVLQSLFQPKSATISLPEALKFSAKRFLFWDALEKLLTRALVKRDKSSKSLSLHRLVQESFKYSMSSQEKQQCFNNAATLIHLAFPQHDERATLYQKWDQCALLLPHVLSLTDCFKKEKALNREFRASTAYCELANLCERYLLEINAHETLEELVEADAIALRSLPSEDQTWDMQGSITSYKGQLYLLTGRAHESVEIQKESYEIRTLAVPQDLRETAWGALNAANAIASTNDFAEAAAWHERAINHWLEYEKERGNEGVYPPSFKRGYATTLLWSGERERARALLDHAVHQVETSSPFNWSLGAFTHFSLGTLDRHERKYDSSESHFLEAENIWTKGDSQRNDPFYAACAHRLGCVSLDQGNIEAAIKHLSDARMLTERRKSLMKAEYARCLFKFSEALQQEPRRLKEAGKLRDDAEQMLRELNPRVKNFGLESEYDSQVYILWR